MGKTILDLLNNVQKDDTSNPNSRVLIIDGLNLYLRTFAVNGMLNDRGVPIGGMMGFLKSSKNLTSIIHLGAYMLGSEELL